MAGKGDTRRPAAVPEEQVAANWERTFRTERVHGPDCLFAGSPINPNEVQVCSCQ